MHKKVWDDTEKAWWVLQNGTPSIVWIYELVRDKIYSRPSKHMSKNLPPWIDKERVEIDSKIEGKKFTQIIIDEFENNCDNYMRKTMTQFIAPQNIDKQQLKALLREGLVTVTFTKKNGEQRVMTCTLNSNIIPQDQLPKPLAEGAEPRKRNDDNVSVWDVNAGGWRSFIWQNVTDVQVANQ